jgi:hypothetical protein
MSSYRASVLQRFDNIIHSLEELVSELPVPVDDRSSTRGYVKDPSKEQLQKFYAIRSAYLDLLNSLGSDSDRIRAAIDFVRDREVYRFYVAKLLSNVRELRSDYEAGLLTTTTSSKNKFQIAEQKLRECIYEIEHLERPYPSADIDRIEKQINSAIRMSFGEESSQYQEIYKIFHMRARRLGMTTERVTQIRIEDWEDDRPEILNSLYIMIDEIKHLQSTAVESATVDAQLLQVTTSKQVNLQNFLWLVISILFSIVIFTALRVSYIYSHPNKFAVDIAIAILIGSLILFLGRPKWRSQVGIGVIVVIGATLLSLLTGVQ